MNNIVLPWEELLTRPKNGLHAVQIYQDEAFLTKTVKLFIESGLKNGDGVIIVATIPHKQSFTQQLSVEGFDLDEAVQRGQLKLIDTDTMLSKFVHGGMPDWSAFRSNMGNVMEDMRQSYPRIRVYGEMVDRLWRQGDREAAIRLEEFWNELAKLYPFSLLCAYFMDGFCEENYDGDLQCICKNHTHLIPVDDYDQFEKVVNDAAQDVLGKTLNNKIYTLSAADRPLTNMPFAQATILWLRENMPLAAKKVLSRVRLWYKPTKNGSVL
jgi:hypothetical protein